MKHPAAWLPLAFAAFLALLVAGCAPKPPDYQSILSTTSTSTSAAAATPTEKPIPLPDYLSSIGVMGQPAAPDKLPDLTVSIPTPTGWSRFTDPHIAPQTFLISKGRNYPTARLVVFALRGDFDPAEAIKHANEDSRVLANFKQLDASSADYRGFPSSMIQGSYDGTDGTRLHSWNRIVIATGSGPAKQRYLVQLTITSLADQAVAQSDDIEAIIRGFVVAAK